MDTNAAEPKSNQIDPDGTSRADEPKGLGGWLVLVGLGLVLSPLRIAYDLYSIHFAGFVDGSFAALTDPSSPTFVNMLGPLVILETAVNALLLAWSIYLAVQFLKEKKSFPRSYQLFLLAVPAVLIGDVLLAGAIMPSIEVFDRETARSLGQSLGACLIWIPYMAISKRVKNTFVR